MKVLLTKASDWDFEKIIEIDDIMELKDFGNKESKGRFVIDFELEGEAYKNCDFGATIYDNYIE